MSKEKSKWIQTEVICRFWTEDVFEKALNNRLSSLQMVGHVIQDIKISSCATVEDVCLTAVITYAKNPRV
jgi:hypothetical protein